MAYSVETLKRWRREAKNNRRVFINRRDAVKKPFDNSFFLNGYYSKIKKGLDECVISLSSGIVGISIVSQKCDSILSNRENQYLTDQYQYSLGLSSMASEVRRCQNNIDDYDRKIAQYERQIRDQGGVILPWE